jgi:hypothetical protein
MAKIIRATVTIELPYRNDLMNYGSKFSDKLKQIIADADFVPSTVHAGELEPCKSPVLKDRDLL